MPRNLLLADDSITIQKVVGITFAGEDFTIVSVDNGEDAVRKAREIRPDIVLADVVMPKKNGYEVCEIIKRDPEIGHIPVLLLAGTFEAFDESRARAARADGHIAKPFESQVLVDKVRELLDRPRLPPSAARAVPPVLSRQPAPNPSAPNVPESARSTPPARNPAADLDWAALGFETDAAAQVVAPAVTAATAPHAPPTATAELLPFGEPIDLADLEIRDDDEQAERTTPGDGGEEMLREALSRASREVIEKIAWEVIPTLAETIIREHVERLVKQRDG